nr:MAG TPA: PolyVal ADP-Ribosyltransferase [Caudoviricetes sp.]
MTTASTLGIATGGGGAAAGIIQGLSASGSYMLDAKDRGMNENQCKLYGGIMGVVEGATGALTFGNSKIAGKTIGELLKGGGVQGAKNIAKQTSKEIAKKETLRTGGKALLINAMEEGFQEGITEPIQELTAGWIGGKDKANWENMPSRILSSAAAGAFSSTIVGGANIGVYSCMDINAKISNGETVTQQELVKAYKDASKKLDTKKIMDDTVKQYQTIIQNQTQNENMTPNQQITQQQNNLSQNQSSEQIKAKEALKQEIQNSNLSSKEKNNMIDYVNNNNINPNTYKNMGESIDNVNQNINNNLSSAPEIYSNRSLKNNAQIIRRYHGTDAEFNEYNLNEFGKHDQGDFGKAIYFAKDKKTAGKYGKNIKENNISLKNPLVLNNEQDYQNMWHILAQRANINNLSKEDKIILNDNYTSQADKDFMIYDKLNAEEKSNILQQLGYDGVIDNTYNQITVFDPANIESNAEMLYNSSNESESGINGKIQSGRMAELSGQYDTRLQQNSKQQNRQYTKREYEQWERNIIPTEENELTPEQKQIRSDIKRQYNKDIVFFDANENIDYNAGASLIDKNKLYINPKQAETFGTNKVIYHEIAESNILHNREISNDIIQPAIEKIINDDNFEHQKQIFWNNQNDTIPSDYAIAKDILCDRFAELKSGEKLDYDNVLSQETNMNIDYALDNFHQELEKSSSINLLKKQAKLPKMKDITSKGEIVNFSEMERPSGKIRKHYKSIIESSNTTPEAKAIAKKMMGTDTYIPESNNNQLERANKRIENSTPDAELQSLMSRSTLGDKITPTDIAVGERLIQYYSLVGDKAKLQDAIQATAMAGTTAGQTVQAMSLLNHQTPEGQAIWIQRSVEKMNEALRKNRGENTEQFNLTPDMLESIVNSKNETELQENVNKVYEELGQQVSKSTMEKIDSWRYFAMLANPRTHIRNIVGNIAMGKTQSVKNKVAGVIEGVASKINSDMVRTHTIVPSSAKVKEFAKNDIVNVLDRLGISENKYNPQTRLQNSMKTFKSDMLENTIGKAFGLNDKLLEAEDGWGLKAGYEKALAEYMTANKLTPDNITDAQLGKARNYAVQQAKEATFHQECQLASLVNQLSNKNKFAKYTTDAILPFVKTPMNVAKAGVEYSPIGLAKSMVLDTSRLRKGDININQYIDNISKGLTGSGIALVGYALSQCGILKASGDEDDKKEKYDENQGKQTYSITIGDNTYSLDWLAPTGIPLFIGAEISEMSRSKAEEKTSSSSDSDSKYNQMLESGTNLLNAMSNAMNPMTEMSMLSGLTSALSSYEQGSAQMLASMGTNSLKSYVNQFVPTALGQVAKTTDEYERSTTSTRSGILPKAIDSTKNQIMSKIPGLRQKLPTKTDVWGNDLKQNEGQDITTQVLDRTVSTTGRKFIENAILPWTRKEISSNNVDKELTELYDLTGESSVLPSTLDKTLTIDGQKYRMTLDEYANYKKQYGKTAFTTFSNIIKTNDYKNLSEGSRKEVIEDIYSYSKELVKKDYAEKNNLEYTPSTMMKTINSIENNGGNVNTYFKFQSAISQLKSQKVSNRDLEEGQSVKDTDKMQLLVDSNYSNKEKSAIFENCILNSSENNFYKIALKNSTIDINEYLKYKIEEANEEFASDKDKYGNSISGTSKKKYYNYINNNITGYNNKLLLLAQKYKLSDNERNDLTEYINENYEGQDRIDVFKKLTQNYKVSNDNKIYYK